MTRASDISSISEFEIEHLREDLRDRRSSRFRRNLQAFAIATAQMMGALVSALGLAHLLGWL